MISPLQAVNTLNEVRQHASDQPMTPKQKVLLAQLCKELDEPMDEMLTQEEAAQRIAGLQKLKSN